MAVWPFGRLAAWPLGRLAVLAVVLALWDAPLRWRNMSQDSVAALDVFP